MRWLTRLVIVAALVAAGVFAKRALKSKPMRVDVAVVERGTVRDEVSSAAAGEVMAAQKATVRAEISARVVALNHRRGERVKRGDAVVTLDTRDLDARLREALATTASQRAAVAQAEARADAARATAEREQRLAAHGAEPVKAAEDAAAQQREADAALRTAKAAVEQSQAAYQVAKVARSDAVLTAPFDGLLAEVFVEVGDQTVPGSNVFELVDDSRLHVEATIDEADIARVKLDQPATLRLDALPGQPLSGVVSRLDPTVRTDAKGARTLRIEVEVSDLKAALAAGVRPGMSANVDVRVAEKTDVLSLPTSVIIGRGTKRSVDLIQNGVVVERPIQVGISSWERTEIVAGLRAGDRVVASLNLKGLAEGVHVEPKGAAVR
jgi:RND family efflux transporter MFP subunit